MNCLGLFNAPKLNGVIVFFALFLATAEISGAGIIDFDSSLIFYCCQKEDRTITLDIPDTNLAYELVNEENLVFYGPKKTGTDKISFTIKSKHIKTGSNDFICSGKSGKKTTFSSNVLIISQPLPKIDITGPVSVCPNANEVIYSTIQNPNYHYNWRVSGGEIIDNDTASIIFIDWNAIGPGKIFLITTEKTSGCANQQMLEVNIEDDAGPLIKYCPNDQVLEPQKVYNEVYYDVNTDVLDIVVSDNCGIASVYNDLNFSSSLIGEKIYGATTITWTASDKYGNTSTCKYTVDLALPDPVTPPTAISPNGDGINDTWRISEIEKYPNAIVKVMDKRGSLVFESERGYPYEWDGTANGMELDVDTYYYIIILDKNHKPIRGQLTIIK
jgi:gliding motility-associated-like protein